MKSADSEVRRIVVLPDVHVPLEDRKACGAVFAYLEDEHVDDVIQLGDLLDINSISAHNHGKPKLVEGERLAEDYAYANRWLDTLTQVARNKNPTAKVRLIKGNHEHRVDRFIEANPALDGLINVEIGLRLKERGIIYTQSYPSDDVLTLGHASFLHGTYTGGNPAKKHVDSYGVNLFFGHCFDEETELLTTEGWKKREQLKLGEPVITLNKSTRELEWNVIRQVYDYEASPTMVAVRGLSVDLLVTEDHGLVARSNNGVDLDLFRAVEFTERSSRTLICAGKLQAAELPYSLDEIRLIVWIAADGCFENNSKACRWHLRKQRKIDRLSALLNRLGIAFSARPQKSGTTKIYANLKENVIMQLFSGGKTLPRELMFGSLCQRQAVLEEYGHTDGTILTNGLQISTSKLDEANLLQAIAVVSGKRCNLITRTDGGYVLSICNRETSANQNSNCTLEDYSGAVWCVTVDNGTLLTRRRGKVCVTQNTHSVGAYSKILKGRNKTLIGVNAGCLCRYDQAYVGHRPTDWQHAIVTLHMLPNGYFSWAISAIFDGQFVGPNGRKYSYRDRVKAKKQAR